jgi:beta-glucosidase
MPEGFLWGAAISAHQSEGNDVNSDSWLLEHLPETVFKEPSGDACDSYHRYEQDFAIARSIGLNCYRFGIEWARIEPEPGRFARTELAHYGRVLASCRAHGLLPIVIARWVTRSAWPHRSTRRTSICSSKFCGQRRRPSIAPGAWR